ncbi:hypothetical protein [Neisseria perflava]|uniref:hypothetical protein n=1 Tax=Neisseria perflava TaxID=33053 RepID=UPI00209DBF45|nr:hypothetical protein [Neisseria perflava]MCP1661149.1 hypothetical protein [Neisseria perflava]
MQTYEEYWRFTNEYTDYNGQKFLTTLKLCIAFIEEHLNIEYSENLYHELQETIRMTLSELDGKEKNLISIRKSINQLVKMGFINPFLASYHPSAQDYLSAATNKKRSTLLSKIIGAVLDN